MKKSSKQSVKSMPDYVPMSAQQEQDEAVLEALSVISDAPEAQHKSPTTSAKRSPLLQELKEDLLARGMSDDDAEEFLRMI